MKTTLRNVFALTVMAAAFTACSDDDKKASSSFELIPSAFEGDIEDGEVVPVSYTHLTLPTKD